MEEKTAPVLLKSRCLGDEFYSEFSKLYNSFKEKGNLPIEIRDKIKDRIDCSDTRYYYYLKQSRDGGFIQDSYEENWSNSKELRRQKIIAYNKTRKKKTTDVKI